MRSPAMLALVLVARMVVTQAMMLALGDGKLALADLVDPAAGVVFIDHSAIPRLDAPPRPAPRLLCGAALDRFVAGWQTALAGPDGIRADREDGVLECHNRPGPPTCTFGRLDDEWDPTIHFIFRVDPERGVRLLAVTMDDEKGGYPRVIAAEHRAQARTIARLSAHGCPP